MDGYKDLIEEIRNPTILDIDLDRYEHNSSQTLGIDEYQRTVSLFSAVIEGVKAARKFNPEKIVPIAQYLETKVRNIVKLDERAWNALLDLTNRMIDLIGKTAGVETEAANQSLKNLKEAIVGRILALGVFTDKKPGSDIVL